MARIDPRLGGFAKTMRNAPTPFEARLWRALSGSKLAGLKFRRQTVIAGVILDFFCPALGLAVEVDGRTHDADRDAERDTRLLALGIRVLRFTNDQIADQLDTVLRVIVDQASGQSQRWPGRVAGGIAPHAALTPRTAPTPGPSPEGEGRR
jgi:very-short-patch-repair endonuclease